MAFRIGLEGEKEDGEWESVVDIRRVTLGVRQENPARSVREPKGMRVIACGRVTFDKKLHDKVSVAEDKAEKGQYI